MTSRGAGRSSFAESDGYLKVGLTCVDRMSVTERLFSELN